MLRHEARRAALMLLFSASYRAEDFEADPEGEVERFLRALGEPGEEEKGLGFIARFADGPVVHKDERTFILHLVSGAVRDRERLDEEVRSAGSHWAFHRIGLLEKTILRLAIFELSAPDPFGETLAPEIVLDEAVELAKIYGSEETPKFVNGVLDAVARRLGAVAGPSSGGDPRRTEQAGS